MSPKKAPYGTWISHIKSDAVTQKSIAISDIIVDPITKEIYHIEETACGAYKLVKTITGENIVAGDRWNVRSGVHKYGGGAAKVEDDVFYFSNYSGPAYSMIKNNGRPRRITPKTKKYRFSAFTIHPTQRNLVVAIMEDHTNGDPTHVMNMLVVIDTNAKGDASCLTKLIHGADFYSNPSFSPDGKYLAWHQWNHPNMPWEGALFCIQQIKIDAKGRIQLGCMNTHIGIPGEVNTLSGGWIDAETATFNSDESGFWNPYIWDAQKNKDRPAHAIAVDEDFDKPAWLIDNASWCILNVKDSDTMRLSYAYRRGRTVLYALDIKSGKLTELESPYVDIDHLRRVDNNHFVFLGSLSDAHPHIARGKVCPTLDGGYTVTFEVLKYTVCENRCPSNLISIPESEPWRLNTRVWPIYVVLYCPKNPGYEGSSIKGELPPCIVNVHDGPARMENQSLSWEKQYFTSRGFAWLDVNCRGSPGFGRKYMQRHTGQLGIVEVADCINAMMDRQLSSKIDIERAVIRSKSSGGFTALAAVANAPNPMDLKVFKAATSYYGISNLELLAQSMHWHKFESRYLERLLGGTYQEIPGVYRGRSPVNHADRIVTPLLLLQGELDEVSPLGQAQRMRDAIKGNRRICKLKYYEGEGHGFANEENQKDALEEELHWYKKMLRIQ